MRTFPGLTWRRRKKKNLLILERGCYFCLRQFERQVPSGYPGRSDKYNAAYLSFASQTHELCLEGKYRYANTGWLNDTLKDIVAAT